MKRGLTVSTTYSSLHRQFRSSIMAQSNLRKERTRFPFFPAGSARKTRSSVRPAYPWETQTLPDVSLRIEELDRIRAAGGPRHGFVFTVSDNAAGSNLARSGRQQYGVGAHWGIVGPRCRRKACSSDACGVPHHFRYLRTRIVLLN